MQCLSEPYPGGKLIDFNKYIALLLFKKSDHALANQTLSVVCQGFH